MGAIVFHKDNGGKGKVVGVWYEDSSPAVIRFMDEPGFVNDDARSLRLIDIPKNTTITVYNDSNGKKSKDWARISVRKNIREYSVNSFETSYEDANVEMEYFRREGDRELDGKVSRVEVDMIGSIEQ